MTAPWTPPDPFISSANNPVSYYGTHLEEVQREISDQASALDTTLPHWYRYLSATGREDITSAVRADSSGESLISYDYSHKPYITDIRDAYEGTGGATGVFSAWDITKQEYLEAKYDTAPYTDWVHSAGALSEDGDCYDRDLDELRSYVSTNAQFAPDDTFDFGITGEPWCTIYKISHSLLRGFPSAVAFCLYYTLGTGKPTASAGIPGDTYVEHIRGNGEDLEASDISAPTLTTITTYGPSATDGEHSDSITQIINDDVSASLSSTKIRFRSSQIISGNAPQWTYDWDDPGIPRRLDSLVA